MKESVGKSLSWMTNKKSKYSITYKNSIQETITYRVSFFTGIFALLIPFFIKIALWKSAFAVSGEENIQNYNFNSILLYNSLVLIFGYLTRFFFHYQIAFEIKNGELSKYLTKPLDYTGYWLSRVLGTKTIEGLYSLVFIVIVGIAFFGTFKGIPVTNIVCCILVVALSAILNFYIYYCISLLTFWFIEVFSLFTALDFIISFLSGQIVPLDILPNKVGRLLDLLPFSYGVYFPTKIIVGGIDSQEIFIKMGIQIVWIILLSILSKVMWKIGILKYESVGG